MPPPTDDAEAIGREFYEVTGARGAIRVSVRAIVILDGHILLQRLTIPDSVWFFPGGGLEFGESLEAGLRRELAEETSLNFTTATYRFVANNRFEQRGYQFHLLEHYFEVNPVGPHVHTDEAHIDHEWIAISDIGALDLRPFGVRDILSVPGWRDIRVLEVS